MSILNKSMQNLGSKISRIKDEERAVSYSAVVYIIVNNMDNKEYNMDTKLFINDKMYELNEVAIIDKDMFRSIFDKFLEFNNSPMTNDSVVNDFNDIINVNKIFGKGIVDSINNNIDIFRDTMLAAKSVYTK